MEIDRQRGCRGLKPGSPIGRYVVAVIEHEDAAGRGHQVLEYLQPFSAERMFEICEPSNVAARMSETLNETLRDRVGDELEHDRNCRGPLAERYYGRP